MHAAAFGAAATALVIAFPDALPPAAAQTADGRAVKKIEAALANMLALTRPRQDGLATIWDGNKFVQCRKREIPTIRCEATGTLMQPSLAGVLTPEHIGRLATLGWRRHEEFGNYVRDCPGTVTAADLTRHVIAALRDGYDADIARVEVATDWIPSMACPPRSGPSQNLAGSINGSRTMSMVAIYACRYVPPAAAPKVTSRDDLIGAYGLRAAAEIQRLRVNIERQIYVVLATGTGYVQCAPHTSPPAVYCETQSAESWPALARLVTPDHFARLRALGFAEPGRSPNYAKTYPLDRHSDAAIAEELLTVLYDVYGYTGSPALQFKSERP
jgi:hypothetical protein